MGISWQRLRRRYARGQLVPTSGRRNWGAASVVTSSKAGPVGYLAATSISRAGPQRFTRDCINYDDNDEDQAKRTRYHR